MCYLGVTGYRKYSWIGKILPGLQYMLPAYIAIQDLFFQIMLDNLNRQFLRSCYLGDILVAGADRDEHRTVVTGTDHITDSRFLP